MQFITFSSNIGAWRWNSNSLGGWHDRSRQEYVPQLDDQQNDGGLSRWPFQVCHYWWRSKRSVEVSHNLSHQVCSSKARNNEKEFYPYRHARNGRYKWNWERSIQLEKNKKGIWWVNPLNKSSFVCSKSNRHSYNKIAEICNESSNWNVWSKRGRSFSFHSYFCRFVDPSNNWTSQVNFYWHSQRFIRWGLVLKTEQFSFIQKVFGVIFAKF